jgi:hypothetical protein
LEVQDKISKWIEQVGLKVQKTQERQWGSYELAFSLDGKHWWHDRNDVFGRGYSTHQAVYETFKRHLELKPMRLDFISFLGREHLARIIEIFNEPEEKPTTALVVARAEYILPNVSKLGNT